MKQIADEVVMVRRDQADPHVQIHKIMTWCDSWDVDATFTKAHNYYLEFEINDPGQRDSFLIKWT